jgi:hypothetical protein
MEIDIESPNNTIHNLRCVGGKRDFGGTYSTAYLFSSLRRKRIKIRITKQSMGYYIQLLEYGWH